MTNLTEHERCKAPLANLYCKRRRVSFYFYYYNYCNCNNISDAIKYSLSNKMLRSSLICLVICHLCVLVRIVGTIMIRAIVPVA